MFERLLIGKQESTFYRVSLLIGSEDEDGLQRLRELIDTVLTDRKANEEIKTLETVVEQLQDSLALKKKVLEYIRAKTKIQQ